MEKRRIVLAIALFGATAVVRAVQDPASVYCMYCTTDAEFAAAGAGEPGAVANGSREVLVVNPDIPEVRRVTLRESPSGRMQVSMTSSVSSADVKRLTDSDVKADIFVPACNGVVKVSRSGGTQAVQPENGERKIERGTFIELADGIYGMVLCQGPQFATYASADRTALSTALLSAQLRWRVSSFKGAIRTYGQVQSSSDTNLVTTPRPRAVCAIFNNGDPACYRVGGAHSGSGTQEAGGAGPVDVAGGMKIVNKGIDDRMGRARQHRATWRNPDRLSKCGQTDIALCRYA